MEQRLENPDNNIDKKLHSNDGHLNQAQDPLEDWRQNKEGTPMGESYDEVGESVSLDQEDSFLKEMELKNSPSKTFKTQKDMLDGQDIHSKMTGGITEEDLLDLEQEYMDANGGESILAPEVLAEVGIDEETEELLGDDIEGKHNERIREILGPIDHDKVAEIKKNQDRTYTSDEFKLLEECSRYMASVALPEKLEKSRPMHSPGVPMTDEQIATQVAALKECQKNNTWGNYKRDEERFMKKCAVWSKWHKKVVSTPLPEHTLEDVKELAQEYHDFRVEKSKAFAEMKFQSGQWSKVDNMEWHKELFIKDKADKSDNGTWQWRAYDTEVDDKGKLTTTMFISNNEPGQMSGEFYYQQKNAPYKTKDSRGDVIMNFVTIRYPVVYKQEIFDEQEDVDTDQKVA